MTRSMECEGFRQELGEWRRGDLPPDRAQALERHLSACPECKRWEHEDRAVSRLLAERLPRYAAAPHLRRQIRQAAGAPARYSGWWAAASAAVATAMLMVVLVLGDLIPALPRHAPPDPLQPLVRAVLSEHTRNLLWGEPHPETVPAALPRLIEETRIELSRVFMGDDEVRLVGVQPVVIENRWGLAFYYRDQEDHTITYLLLAGQGVSVPDRNRVQVDRFRPMLSRVDGFSVFIWKQGGVACFLISDLVSESDLTRFRQYFLRIRSATELVPVR